MIKKQRYYLLFILLISCLLFPHILSAAATDTIITYSDSDAINSAQYFTDGSTVWVKVYDGVSADTVDTDRVDTHTVSFGYDSAELILSDTTAGAPSITGDTLSGDSIFSGFFKVSSTGPFDAYTLHLASGDSAIIYTDLDNLGGTSTYTVWADYEPPTAPVLNNISDTNGDLEIIWAASTDTLSGVSYYKLQVDNDPDFSSLFADSTVYDTNQTLTPVSEDTYYIRIAAYDTAGNYRYSDTINLDSMVYVDLTAPTAPILNAISDTNGDLNISWDSGIGDTLSGISYFKVQVSTVKDFSSLWADSSVYPPTSYLNFTAPPEDTYYIRIITYDSATNYETSDILTTDTMVYVDLTAPTAPILNAISDTNGDLNISWDSGIGDTLSGISYFKVQVSTVKDFSSLWADSDVYPSTSYLNFSNPPDDTYFIRIITYDSATNYETSDIINTDTMVFIDRTGPTQPAIFTVSDTSSHSDTLRWVESTDTQTGVMRYRVQVDTDPNFGNTYLHFWNSDGDTEDSFTFPVSDTYYFRVIAQDSVGNYSAFSDTLAADTEFLVDYDSPSMPVLTDMQDTTETSGILLTWALSVDAVSGMASYRVQFSTDPTFTIITDSDVIVAEPGDTLQVDNLDSAIYYWRMYAQDNMGNTTGWSNSDTFAVLQKLTRLEMSAPTPDSAAAGFTLTITAYDQFGNINDNYDSSALITSTDPSIQPDSTGLGWTNGVKTVSVTLKQIGVNTITVTDGNIDTYIYVDITPGALSYFAVTSDSSNPTSGESFTLTISAYDAAGNLTNDSAVGDTIYLFVSSGTREPDSVAFTDSVVSVQVTVTASGNVTITAKNGTKSGTTQITFGAGSISYFVVSASTTTISVGVPFTLYITAYDASDTVTSSYDGSQAMLNVSGGTILPSISTAFSNGTATVSVSLTGVGNLEITAHDGSGHSGTTTIAATPGVWNRFILSTSVSEVSAGIPFTLNVTALDYGGNVSPDSDGTNCTFTVDSGWILPETGTAFSGGTISLQVSLNTPGTITITAGTDGISGTTQIYVTPGQTDSFVLSVSSTNVSVGVPFTINITAYDAYGNVTYDSNGVSSTLEVSTGTIVPSAATAFSGIGISQTSVSIDKTGSVILTARDSGGNIYDTVTLSCTNGPAVSFSVSVPATTIQAGDSFNVNITALDYGGQTALSYNTALNVTVDNGFYVYPSSVSNWTNGELFESLLIKTNVDINPASNITITFTDGSITGTGTINIIDTTPPQKIAFTSTAGTIVTSPNITFTISARDTGTYQDTPVLMGVDTYYQVSTAFSTYSNSTNFILNPVNGDYKYLFYIDFEDLSGNKSSSNQDTAYIILDQKNPFGLIGPPINNSVTINNGDSYTNSPDVSVNIKSRGATYYRISQDSATDFTVPGTIPWTVFPFASGTEGETTVTFTLDSSDGLKTVYVQLRDDVDPSSYTENMVIVSDTIYLDQQAPSTPTIVIDTGATISGRDYTSTTSVYLTVSYDTIVDTDITGMVISGDIVGGETVITPFDSRPLVELTAGDGIKTVYVVLTDSSGLEGDTGFDTIVLDQIDPLGPPEPSVWIEADTVVNGDSIVTDTLIIIHFGVTTGDTAGVEIRFGQYSFSYGGGAIWGPDVFSSSSFQAFSDTASYSIQISPDSVDDVPIDIGYQYKDNVDTSTADTIRIYLNNAPPQPATDLSYSVNQSGTVTLRWTASNSGDSITYLIFSDTGGINYKGTVGTVNYDTALDSTMNTSIDVPFAVNFGESYIFAVRAQDYVENRETNTDVKVTFGDTFLTGDINGDNQVDDTDLTGMLQYFGMERSYNVTLWDNTIYKYDIVKTKTFGNGVSIDSTDKIDVWDVRKLMLKYGYGN